MAPRCATQRDVAVAVIDGDAAAEPGHVADEAHASGGDRAHQLAGAAAQLDAASRDLDGERRCPCARRRRRRPRRRPGAPAGPACAAARWRGDVGERHLGAEVERVRERLLAPRLLDVELARLVAHGGQLLEIARDDAAERDATLVQFLDAGGAGDEPQIAAVRQLVERAQPALELGAPLVRLILQRVRPALEIVAPRPRPRRDRHRPPPAAVPRTRRPETSNREIRRSGEPAIAGPLDLLISLLLVLFFIPSRSGRARAPSRTGRAARRRRWRAPSCAGEKKPSGPDASQPPSTASTRGEASRYSA